jgi:SNF2 family DNA or RNA helicase
MTTGPTRWAHQTRELERSKDQAYWALFMEQRTGKTPVLIDTVRHLWLMKCIDGQIHMAPNGVHGDYVREYLPTYMGDLPWRAYTWRASKADQVGETKAREALLRHAGLAILSVNIDAIKTLAFRKFAARFMKSRKVLASIDESLDIAKWTKRTRVALNIGLRAAYRRILDGTPADASPLGLYYQCQFLQPGSLGFRSKIAFQQRYAVMEARCITMGMRKHELTACPRCGKTVTIDTKFCIDCNSVVDPVCPHCHQHRAEFTTIEDYQNIDELRAKVAKFSSRVLREECTDMPPKVYERRTFVLAHEQRAVYDRLRAEYYAELADGGEVDGAHVLTRMLRLQQISSNHLPAASTWVQCTYCEPPFHECEHCGGYGFVQGAKDVIKTVGTTDARLNALDQTVAQLRPSDQVVVWSRFRADRDTIGRWAAAREEDCIRYDGLVGTAGRQVGYDLFRSGHARYFNGDPVTGGRGLDLSCASCVIYYSHGWSLRFRRQSEDRVQNLQKKDPTLYVDLVAEDTVDHRILDELRAGKDLAAQVMGDPAGVWL